MGYFSERDIDLQYDLEDDMMVFDRKQRVYLSSYDIPDDKAKLKRRRRQWQRKLD